MSDYSNVVRQHWSNDIQENLEKQLLGMDLATMVDIPDGTTKNLPILDAQSVSSYTKNTEVVFGDLNTDNDTIVINTTPLIAFQMDEIDAQDNYIDVVPEAIQNASYQLKANIDGDFLSEIANSFYTYGASGLAKTTGSEAPVVLTEGASENVSTVFLDSQAHLVDVGANDSKLVAVADPKTVVKMVKVGLEKGYKLADEAISRGAIGAFVGLPVYKSALIKHSRVLDLATQPTDGDTVTVKDQTFTFKTTLGTTAGNVLIGASADAARANLAAAINGSAGAGTTYVDVEDRSEFNGVVATNDNGADTLTLVSKRGSLRASSALTAAADDFRAEVADNAVMEKGAIHMALRRQISIKMATEARKLVDNYLIYSRYGLKTTKKGAKRMVRVAVQSAAAE